ncbi:MAG: SpoIIE family protein phosphatase [Spirochaetota bacterium]
MEGRRVRAKGLEYQTSTVPSKLVDGDFLDVLKLTDSTVDFILGDVMGKGMDAAILGAMIKLGFVRSLAISLSGTSDLPEPASICAVAEAEVVNHLLARKSYATLTYARFDELRRALMFVDCGHTSLIHFSRRTGQCWRVKGGNMPLGFAREQVYRGYSLPVDSGDSLLLFTDGLSECCNRWGEALGEQRIMYLLRSYSDLSVAELASMIMKIGFMYSSVGFNDDVTLICIKETGSCDDPALEGGFCFESFPGVPPDFLSAKDLLDSFLEAHIPALGLSEREKITLAFHEALANVVEHALQPVGGICDLRWRCVDDFLSLEFFYKGPDYDWVSFRNSEVGSLADSGYGRFIMQESMDSVLLAQGFHGRKRLVMCKRISGGGVDV